MIKLTRSTNLTVFVLFFGISVLDALASRNWVRSLLWLGFGLLFVAADGVGYGPSISRRTSIQPPSASPIPRKPIAVLRNRLTRLCISRDSS